MKRSLVVFLLLVAACASQNMRTLPTPPTGMVRGVVADSGGTVLPGVTVTVANRSAVTDAEGRFMITGIPAGEYQFVAELLGFSRTVYRVKLTTDRGAAVYA